VIVADTGAIIALVDADDLHHDEMVALFEADPAGWILPWAILVELDYLLARHVGVDAQRAFLHDVAQGSYTVEWPAEGDLDRAVALTERYPSLRLGLVDAVVMATAERLRAEAIATFDLRDFAAVALRTTPKLYPRDWTG
jgi:predicted nucleic acid-binding protein